MRHSRSRFAICARAWILLGDGGGRKASDPKGNAERPGNTSGNGYADATGRAPRGASRPDPISSGRQPPPDDDIPF